MLEPQERVLLLDSLKPPPGYELSLAVGTTYSLDLLALLTAPVAFTLFDQESVRDDPLGLLHTMREYAGKIRIFCQAGQIKVPQQHQILYSYLEKSVFEVMPPDEDGVFHPKVWALRFQSEGEPVLYRLLVLSRNLTFDRSWDTSLVLDGELTDREYRLSQNYPLGDFFRALPEMSLHEIPGHVKDEIEKVVYEIQRVDWDLPRPFAELKFWALGLPKAKRKWPFEGRVDRMMVISQFLGKKTLDELAQKGEEHVLVSRTESLEALNKDALSRYQDVFALDPGVSAEEELPEGEEGILSDVPFTGLHAKLYIGEMGWDARLWTGSPNATSGGFGKNVEFLVELKGRKSKIGIDVLMQESGDGQVLFRDMLRRLSQFDEKVDEDPGQKELEMILRQTQKTIVEAGLKLIVDERGDDKFDFTLQAPDPIPIPKRLAVRCWPITLDEDRHGQTLSWGMSEIEFGPSSLQALTSFLAVELYAEKNEEDLKSRFVLNLPLQGVPEKRPELVLQSLLQNRGQVLRYLLMLLQDDTSTDFSGVENIMRSGNIDRFYGRGGGLNIPLLETLIHSLSRNPAQLDKVYHLIEDLRRTEKGEEMLPENFDQIWGPIWETRMRLREEQ